MRDPAEAYYENHYNRYLLELQEFLTIPSISSDENHVDDMQQAANWVARRLSQAGIEQVEISQTEGHPIVFASSIHAGESAPTVLIYGHYDVQSPDPLSDWKTKPFEPTIIEDSLFARGATDMKGALMASVAAIEAIYQGRKIPVNIKFLLEGEEEVGSRHLKAFIYAHLDSLSCNYILSLDVGELPSRNTPVIAYSLRGGAAFKLTVLGPREDLHSGIYGGLVHNPVHALSSIIANLHDQDGCITLPDFYGRVRELEDWEHEELASTQLGEDFYRQQTGVPALWGEHRFIPEERVGARPSADVIKFQGGLGKPSIPAEASAVVFFRLVADQDPEEVHQQFRRYLERCAPKTVTWKLDYIAGYPAVLTNRNSKGVRVMEDALRSTFGNKPKFCRGGGSVPAILMLQSALKVNSILTGFSLMDDNMHGPNEKIDLPTWKRGTIAMIHFLQQISKVV
jgi:acetylornithine deacetylase/succinyl-diaminopimelate desuccinylase-like protein